MGADRLDGLRLVPREDLLRLRRGGPSPPPFGPGDGPVRLDLHDLPSLDLRLGAVGLDAEDAEPLLRDADRRLGLLQRLPARVFASRLS